MLDNNVKADIQLIISCLHKAANKGIKYRTTIKKRKKATWSESESKIEFSRLDINFYHLDQVPDYVFFPAA